VGRHSACPVDERGDALTVRIETSAAMSVFMRRFSSNASTDDTLRRTNRAERPVRICKRGSESG